jgi:hypothetical protein
MARWTSSPVTWEAGAECSSGQRWDPGSGGLMINQRSGRPAVPPPAPLGVWGGRSQLLHRQLLGLTVAPVPAGPPGLPAAASCRKWRRWRDGRCSGWRAKV